MNSGVTSGGLATKNTVDHVVSLEVRRNLGWPREFLFFPRGRRDGRSYLLLNHAAVQPPSSRDLCEESDVPSRAPRMHTGSAKPTRQVGLGHVLPALSSKRAPPRDLSRTAFVARSGGTLCDSEKKWLCLGAKNAARAPPAHCAQLCSRLNNGARTFISLRYWETLGKRAFWAPRGFPSNPPLVPSCSL